eukprot:scaffold4096_cov237-Pinguiococcus_pyrenoidosus.AAC.5
MWVLLGWSVLPLGPPSRRKMEGLLSNISFWKQRGNYFFHSEERISRYFNDAESAAQGEMKRDKILT